MKTVYLIRHAQSHLTEDVHHSEWPLSERGREQARHLAALLAPLGIEEIFTSPYRRCRETIGPFAAASGVPVSEHAELREHLLAPGLIDDFEQVWRQSWADFSYALPGCETSHAAQARIWAAVFAVAERSSAGTLAISSHGNVLSLLFNRVDQQFALESATAMRNPDVFRVQLGEQALRWHAEWQLEGLAEISTAYHETPIDRAAAVR